MPSEDLKLYYREYMRKRRSEAKENGCRLESDNWAANNKDKHRDKTRKWRANNPKKSAEISRKNQKARRSTPWGKINNRMWPCLHRGIKTATSRYGKYNKVLGYTWLELRLHIGSLFSEDMNWSNWGSMWELDHIKPLSFFRYETIEDDSFAFCWSFENLRPLERKLNQAKGVSRAN